MKAIKGVSGSSYRRLALIPCRKRVDTLRQRRVLACQRGPAARRRELGGSTRPCLTCMARAGPSAAGTTGTPPSRRQRRTPASPAGAQRGGRRRKQGVGRSQAGSPLTSPGAVSCPSARAFSGRSSCIYPTPPPRGEPVWCRSHARGRRGPAGPWACKRRGAAAVQSNEVIPAQRQPRFRLLLVLLVLLALPLAGLAAAGSARRPRGCSTFASTYCIAGRAKRVDPASELAGRDRHGWPRCPADARALLRATTRAPRTRDRRAATTPSSPPLVRSQP